MRGDRRRTLIQNEPAGPVLDSVTTERRDMDAGVWLMVSFHS